MAANGTKLFVNETGQLVVFHTDIPGVEDQTYFVLCSVTRNIFCKQNLKQKVVHSVSEAFEFLKKVVIYISGVTK